MLLKNIEHTVNLSFGVAFYILIFAHKHTDWLNLFMIYEETIWFNPSPYEELNFIKRTHTRMHACMHIRTHTHILIILSPYSRRFFDTLGPVTQKALGAFQIFCSAPPPSKENVKRVCITIKQNPKSTSFWLKGTNTHPNGHMGQKIAN